MEQNKFEAIFPIIIAGLYRGAMEKFQLDEMQAIAFVTKSKLFSFLEREETKVWHYSTPMLLAILENEKKGDFRLPE